MMTLRLRGEGKSKRCFFCQQTEKTVWAQTHDRSFRAWVCQQHLWHIIELKMPKPEPPVVVIPHDVPHDEIPF